MIPTLFGVTVVSFCIMQMAPGDPLLNKLGASGTAGESSQTREAYLIQKRDLKLDKPLVLNFNYFKDYAEEIRVVAHYRAMSTPQIAAELENFGGGAKDVESASRLRFLRKLRIKQFQQQLNPPDLTDEQLRASRMTRGQWQERKQQIRENLSRAVEGYIQIWCENTGRHGVPAAIDILQSSSADLDLKIGAIRTLAVLAVNPFEYTLSSEPNSEEAKRVTATWQILWQQEKENFTEVDPDRRQAVLQQVTALVANADRSEMFQALQSGDFDRDDAPILADVLLGDSTLAEKAFAAEFLRLYIAKRVRIDVPRNAQADEVEQVAQNWRRHYQARQTDYEVSFGKKLWYIVGDTQYAHMVWRLVTFQFGRSALKTREPVSQMLWRGAVVSVPLMFMAQIVIYIIAVPLGVICSVNRGRWLDRLISLKLFLLYSVPPFVAGMMFLLFFCYGSYLKWFPMERLHSPGAENFGFAQYVLDYLWHAFLPVTCLSLFSLAGLAMYARTSMLDVLGQDYIRTARAKGVSRTKVVLKHALRNGMIPIITLFANFLPALLGGSVLIEVIFNVPGLGRLGFVSIEQKDFPTLMALIYIDALVVMLSILMTDILYVFVDPRISFEGQGKTA
jgi:ABC-type dipeptide/oligopeptide/nickel transport system permease component